MKMYQKYQFSDTFNTLFDNVIGDNMKNYEKVLHLGVFELKDICKLTGNINTAKSLIRNLLLNGYIKRIKHNLYAVCDVAFRNTIPSQYEIASKIKKDAYISYHSALEYYGVKNQVFYQVYVATEKRFPDFEFEGITYKYINSKYNFGIMQERSVRVTDKERTVIDCIDRPELAGGNEELFVCLELMIGLDEDKMLQYLKQYNSPRLYAKVGFMLELLNEHFGLSEKMIEECRKNIHQGTCYFDSETRKQKSKYISKWNLIVPEIFLTRGRTIYW